MKYLIVLLGLCCGSLVYADSFDKLLQDIQHQSNDELAENKARVSKFVSDKKNQAALLKQAQETLAGLIAESERLNAEMDDNEQQITVTEEALQRKVGDLGELFGGIRQVSGELQADFKNSMTSVQYPERMPFLDTLAQSKELPDVKALEKLWFVMLEEMGESGKTRQFGAEVTRRDGSTSKQDVTRIGTYAAISNGEYLQHAMETNSLSTLQRQPPPRYRKAAENFTTHESDLIKIMIDPTRGQLLNMLTLKPTLWERINQGGIIGYIIIALGVIGLLIAVLRYIYLGFVSAKISAQAKQLSEPSDKNPLGRVALVYRANRDKSLQEREIALEEAMMKEAPVVERYNGLIKLLAAVSPLLGLLGTVIGMIITFQSITLFGTSDPKLMAGGISTALVTTVLGLSVAIPLLFAHTFIASKSKRIIDMIEHQSVGLIAREL